MNDHLCNSSPASACGDSIANASFPAFAAAWSAAQGLALPALHFKIAEWLDARWRARAKGMVLLAFRGAGKSTLVGLFAAWLLARDPELRLLVLAADLALARRMVRNVKRIIERHPETAALKPKKPDQWASEQFTVVRRSELRDPSMLARGIDSNITGSRADVVICDDVEVPNTADTAAKREDLRERLREIDYVLVPDGTRLYLGTPHAYHSIYARVARPETGEERPFLDGHERAEIPLLDAEGNSAWPERFTPEAVERIRRSAGPLKFASQMLLQPVDPVACTLDPARLLRYGGALDYREGNGGASLWLEGRRLASLQVWWDPAYGRPAPGGRSGGGPDPNADCSVVAAVFQDEAGHYWLHRLLYMTFDPARLAEQSEAAQLCAQVAAFALALHAPAVTVETNGLGKLLPGLLRDALAGTPHAPAVIEKSSTRRKEERILAAFDAPLAAGLLHAHESVWDTPFIEEMRAWRPAARSRQRDDGLDAVAGALLAEAVRLPRVVRGAGHRDWRSGARPFTAMKDFTV